MRTDRNAHPKAAHAPAPTCFLNVNRRLIRRRCNLPMAMRCLFIMTESKGDPKPYLEYLDKEMTIMGILSTFCVAAASLVVDRVASAEKESLFKSLSEHHSLSVFVGSGFLVAAGLCFYLQRSILAHLYGGICMSIAHRDFHKRDTRTWLREAYSWRTWLRYRTGFTFLMLATVVY